MLTLESKINRNLKQKKPCNHVSLLALDPLRIKQDSISVSIKFKATNAAIFCN